MLYRYKYYYYQLLKTNVHIMFNITYIKWIEVKICGAWSIQPINLLLGSQN